MIYSDKLTFDFTNMLSERVGVHGLTRSDIAELAAKLPAVHQAMCDKKAAMAWRALPYNQSEIIERIKAAGSEINARFDAFVVLGIGGSALGSKALFSACKHFKYNELPRDRRGGVRFYVEDNVDPDRMNALFDVIDPAKTAFHVITKSGNTVETISQFMIVMDMLKSRIGDSWRDNIYITTDAQKGNLKRIADENGFEPFVVPDGVGGRFSVLCPVGLLSAAALNIDIDALLAGAAAMDAACVKPDVPDNPAYLYALLYAAAMKRGANVSVLLPYADALQPTAEWYCQLWAESLGKRTDLDGKTVNCGQTPVRTIGVTDQHSQIQLYNEGPFDKIISFIAVDEFSGTLAIPKPPIDVYDANYLAGQTLNTLIASERAATVYAVTSNGKMNNTITLSRLNEYTLGMLLYFFEMATAATGEFLHINAFDQPGVEEGKIATFALMGREGYEEKAAELRSLRPGDRGFTCCV